MSSDKKKKRKVEAKDDDDKEDLEQWTHVFGGASFVFNCYECRDEIIKSKASRPKRLAAMKKLYMDIRGVCDELDGLLSESPDAAVDKDPAELSD